MFSSRTRRVWGHAAIFAWSDLAVDRSRKLACLQSPAACATRVGSAPAAQPFQRGQRRQLKNQQSHRPQSRAIDPKARQTGED